MSGSTKRVTVYVGIDADGQYVASRGEWVLTDGWDAVYAVEADVPIPNHGVVRATIEGEVKGA